MTSPLAQLTLTRIRLFFREPGAVFWTFGFPILLTIALGVAFRNRPADPVEAAVEDGPGADAIGSALQASPGMRVWRMAPETARTALRIGRVAIVITPGPSPTYRYDPSRPESRLARVAVDDALQRAAGRRDAAEVHEARVTEPGSRYVDFLLPGLIGLNVMSSGMWGIGYVIAETRSKKLLKRMLATPMRRDEFLLSFILMRLFFLLLELPLLVGFGHFAFGVPLRGSVVLLFALSLLGALAFSGLGLLVAARARNTQTVNGLINLVILPMSVLSGVFFSYARFPDVVQPAIRALPLTALNDAMRAVMNEGAGAAAVAPQAAILAAVALTSFTVSLKLFRWN